MYSSWEPKWPYSLNSINHSNSVQSTCGPAASASPEIVSDEEPGPQPGPAASESALEWNPRWFIHTLKFGRQHHLQESHFPLTWSAVPEPGRALWEHTKRRIFEADLMGKGKEQRQSSLILWDELSHLKGTSLVWVYRSDWVLVRVRQNKGGYAEFYRMSFRYSQELWPGQTGRIRKTLRIEPGVYKLF